MTTIVTRAGKGSPLTHTEVDTNFTNLNTAKLEAGAIALGTAAEPSISFTGDTNTGIYSPGADQLAVATNGTQRLLIKDVSQDTLRVSGVNATINIDAIGSNFPGLKLAIAGSDLAGFVGFSGSNATLLTYGALPLLFGTGSTERMRITSAGLVGIGTTSPEALLHLLKNQNGNTGFLVDNQWGTSGASAGLTLKTADVAGSSTATFAIDKYKNGSATIANNETNSAGNLSFNVGISERVRIDSSGRLLVGTSTARNLFFSGDATAQAQIEGNSTSTASLSITRNDATADGNALVLAKARSTSYGIVVSNDRVGRISFQGADGTNMVPAASIESFVDGDPGSADMPGRLVFSTTADGASSPTERMRITSGGRAEFTCVKDNNAAIYILHNGTNGTQYGITVTTATDQNDTIRYFLDCTGGGTTRAVIRSNGGLANYSANNANLSDINTKKDITPAAGTWDCIKEWEIVNYRYKDQSDDADLNLGVIAQQVAESCPEVITIFQEAKEATDEAPAKEERLGVKEQQMMWMAIKALQEAMGRIEQLETEMAAVKAQLS